MAKVYDVPADVLIDKLTEILKNEDLPAPVWTSFVKTGSHADKPPQKSDWWYTRCASIMRKVYLHGPMGVNDFRKVYGGGKAISYGARNHRDAGGVIIRKAIQGLEKLGYIDKVAGKGRVISKTGMQKLDRLATEILTQLVSETPKLKVYT
jgi:small subunit ribosomal protein S19e